MNYKHLKSTSSDGMSRMRKWLRCLLSSLVMARASLDIRDFSLCLSASGRSGWSTCAFRRADLILLFSISGCSAKIRSAMEKNMYERLKQQLSMGWRLESGAADFRRYCLSRGGCLMGNGLFSWNVWVNLLIKNERNARICCWMRPMSKKCTFPIVSFLMKHWVE